MQRIAERPPRTPQPEPPGKIAEDPPETSGREDPSLRSDSGTHGSPEHGEENDGAEERSDEDRPGWGMGEQHEEREQENGDPGRPSLSRIGEEPQCRGTEQERDEIVDVANERAKVQRRRRDHGHRHEDQWVSSKTVPDRGQGKDQQDLAARHKQGGQRLPVHVANLANQRADERRDDSVATPKNVEGAVGKHQFLGRMADEHLGPPRVPGHVRTRSEATRIANEGPDPDQRHARRHQEDQQRLRGQEDTSPASRRERRRALGGLPRPESGHPATFPSQMGRCRPLGDEGRPR